MPGADNTLFFARRIQKIPAEADGGQAKKKPCAMAGPDAEERQITRRPAL